MYIKIYYLQIFIYLCSVKKLEQEHLKRIEKNVKFLRSFQYENYIRWSEFVICIL